MMRADLVFIVLDTGGVVDMLQDVYPGQESFAQHLQDNACQWGGRNNAETAGDSSARDIGAAFGEDDIQGNMRIRTRRAGGSPLALSKGGCPHAVLSNAKL